MGIGYLGGFPNSENCGRHSKGDFSIYFSAWAPFTTCMNVCRFTMRVVWRQRDAKDLFLTFCDWGISITSNLNDEQMQEMLNMEHGGMNEVFADAYQITGDEKYLVAAKRYSHNVFLEPLSDGVDNLDNNHANPQIPKFIGFARIAELSGDKITVGRPFSWETIVNDRSLAFCETAEESISQVLNLVMIISTMLMVLSRVTHTTC